MKPEENSIPLTWSFLKDPGFIFGSAIVIFYLVFLFIYRYEPSIDEVFQINAANRLNAGLGYTTSWVIPEDLAVPFFSYLSAWPIGYSFIISILMKTGLSLMQAAKIFKLAGIISSFIIWHIFGKKFIASKYLAALFSGFLAVFVIITSRTITDLYVVALLGVISLILFSNKLYHLEKSGKQTFIFFLIGLLLSFGIFMKYSALSLVPAIFIWIVYINYKSFKRTAQLVSAFFFPVLVTTSSIFIVNYLNTRNISTLTNSVDLNILKNFDRISFLNHLNAASYQALQIPRILFLALSQLSAVLASAYSTIAGIGLVVYFVYSLRSLSKNSVETKKLAAWFVICYISIGGFLFLDTLLFDPSIKGWTPFTEGRYYTPIAPFLILFLFQLPGKLSRLNVIRIVKPVVFTIMATYIVLLGAYMYRRFRYEKEISIDASQIEDNLFTLAAKERTVNQVVFMDRVCFTLSVPNPKINVFNILPFPVNSRFFSKKTLVVIFCSYKDYYDMSVPAGSPVQEKFVLFANRNSFSELRINDRTAMFWKTYPAGSRLAN